MTDRQKLIEELKMYREYLNMLLQQNENKDYKDMSYTEKKR